MKFSMRGVQWKFIESHLAALHCTARVLCLLLTDCLYKIM